VTSPALRAARESRSRMKALATGLGTCRLVRYTRPPRCWLGVVGGRGGGAVSPDPLELQRSTFGAVILTNQRSDGAIGKHARVKSEFVDEAAVQTCLQRGLFLISCVSSLPLNSSPST
jgi:hypothetical protein